MRIHPYARLCRGGPERLRIVITGIKKVKLSQVAVEIEITGARHRLLCNSDRYRIAPNG